MAIIFELLVQGATDADQERLLEHFRGRKCTLQRGIELEWTATLEVLTPGERGVCVGSKGLSSYGIQTVQEAADMSEAGLYLHHWLLSAPPFRFARVSLEPTNIPLSDLKGWVTTFPDGQRHLGLSCVVDDELLQELGNPSGFRPFRPGYSWEPYQGEDYRPLHGRDHPELWKLRNALFPES